MCSAALLATSPHLSPQWRAQYQRRLLKWFLSHQRDLPWRRTSDPYAIWISESMLQQTQVATVIDYYQRFLRHLPDVRSLAEADEQTVLGLWAGLGYYRRARQLHAAARQIVEEHDGVFPNDVSALMNLPGIGRYTAGAIVSIAFDIPAPILEANTERLFARLMCLQEPPRSAPANDLLWQFAQWQLPSRGKPGARQVNQAAMELGSLICKPLKPLCDLCPLISQCPTAQLGLQATIPVPKVKKEITALRHVALLVSDGHDRWLVRLNPPGAWWAGLWDFPRLDATAWGFENGARARLVIDRTMRSRLQASAEEQLGLRMRVGEPTFQFSHAVTRYRIRVDCVEAVCAAESGDAASVKAGIRSDFQWLTISEITQLPLTAPARKILDQLAKR